MLLYQERTGVLGHPVGPAWMALIASTFSGSGCTPSASNNISNNVIIFL